MDDRNFDDVIKGKLEDLQQEPYDPSALSGLHYRLASVSLEPWYMAYKTAIIAASAVILFTLINSLVYWKISTNQVERLSSEIASLKRDNLQMMDLEEEISRLKTTTPDTVIVEQDHRALLLQLDIMNRRISRLMASNNSEPSRPAAYVGQGYEGYYVLGNSNEIPKDLLKELEILGLIKTEDGETYLIPAGNVSQVSKLTPAYNLDNYPVYPDQLLARIEIDETLPEKQSTISLKQYREIEKHYMKGIGLNIGPTFGVAKAFYDAGSGVLKPNIGILADMLMSPAFSVESGVRYNLLNNQITGASDLQKAALPGLDPGFGELQEAEVESYVLEFPINLRYRHPLSIKSQLISSLGISPLLFTKQTFEYDYLFTLNANDPVNSTDIILNTSTEEKSPKFYLGTLNLSLGAQKLLKNRNFLEISLQYKHGLTKMGEEQTIPKIIGLQAGYWFKVR